jgi:two-component system sensor histidine kinase CiaH
MNFFRTDLFHSARLKLTAFYFAILFLFCVMLTFGVRVFTNHELERGDEARGGAVYKIVERMYEPDSQPPSGRFFANAEQRQSDVTRQNLNRDFLLLDMGLLALGALASYWFAGRTLRPIEEAHEEQKRFTADASHELRTPLASLKLENEVFLRQKDFTEKDARELIASNLEEVDRLERLASNLLALNRYEKTAVSHALTPVPELVEAAIAQAKRSKAAAKVKFMQDVAPAAVDVNRESMVELLAILLDNAVKYGPKDGTVEINGTLETETYALTVRDYGPGISEEDLPHIFERMYRGDKARSSKVSGHGIGLSLAWQIAEANEATLTAGNAPDGGAVFTLTIS